MNPPTSQSQTAPRRKGWRSRLSIWLTLAVALAVIVWFGREILRDWDRLWANLSQASPPVLAAAVACILAFLLLTSLCYHFSLRMAGADVRASKGMSVYLASQLAKYIPGRIAYVAGQIGLAKLLSIPVTQSALGFTAHHVMLLGMAVALASPALGIALSPGVFAALVACAILGFLLLASGLWIRPFNTLRRKRGKSELAGFSRSRALGALLSAGIGWVCYACFATILCRVLYPSLPPESMVRVGMAAVAAWVLGFLSFLTPAGLGVREGMLVFLTRGLIPEPTAMAVALMMRAIHTGLQLPLGGVALGHMVRGSAGAIDGAEEQRG